MCGIVGAVTQNNIVPFLLDGLKRLEYRGYDSAGMAIIRDASIDRKVAVGRVNDLEQSIDPAQFIGTTGIAHTRWATHGGITEANAHPHISKNGIAVVHNGIIENHLDIKQFLRQKGYDFYSETDTEVIVNLVDHFYSQHQDLLLAVQETTTELKGAYALGVISADHPGRLIGTRHKCPLLVGIKEGETFLGSDMSALICVTNQYRVLEDDDIVDINQQEVIIYNGEGLRIDRELKISRLSPGAIALGDYDHFMQKEIFEQGQAIADTLEGRIGSEHILDAAFGHAAKDIFAQTDGVQILACGTSYYAGCVAKDWFEQFGVACDVEISTEFSSRKPVVNPDTLVICISQSGETIDTLNALQYARELGFKHSMTICNVPESSMVRNTDLSFMTHAGPEIGVASTKAFTTQLVALLLTAVALGRYRSLNSDTERDIVNQLRALPQIIEDTLRLNNDISALANRFADKAHCLFLGRGVHFPIALEGALKLKEISYIHAEAYPAGELKHGPLALVDDRMPVIAVAPNNSLLAKIKSNIQEVRARGGQLIVFADRNAELYPEDGLTVIPIAPVDDFISPIIYVVPLQLLAYHVARIKGTDIDKPRNLAKSVTVE